MISLSLIVIHFLSNLRLAGLLKERTDTKSAVANQRDVIDEIIEVETSQANEAARAVAKSDGILVGTSSGAAIWAATQLAKRPEHNGKRIVAILPDTGLRYLSTDLFE